MPCYGNDVLKHEYQGILICGRQKTLKEIQYFLFYVSGSVRCG